MMRVRHLVGAGFLVVLPLALAFGATTGARAAPQITTESGAPLPDPFRPALHATDVTTSAIYKVTVLERLAAANRVGETTKGLVGVAGVHFTVGSDGALVSVAVIRPSGNAAFDANALAMVRKAAPFPPPPPGAEHAFDATIQFHPGGRP